MEDMDKKIRSIRFLKHLQGQEGNISRGEYMVGLHDGLELALSVIEDRDPNYKHKLETIE